MPKSKQKPISKPSETFRGVECEGLVFQLVDSDVAETEDAEDSLVTSDVLLFPEKEIHHPFRDEPFNFDSKFRAGMIRTFKKTGLKIQLDFNHGSGGGFMSIPTQEEGKAAGWIVALEDREKKGLWGKVEWNQSGLNAVRTREYLYISPEFALSYYDTSVGKQVEKPRLFAVALTNRPFLEKQKTLAASHDAAMREKENMSEFEDLKNMISGLNETLSKLAEGQIKLSESQVALSDKVAASETLALAAVEQQKTDQRNLILNNAAKAGRLIPANREIVEKFADTVDAVELTKFIDALPVVTRPQAGTSPDATQSNHQFSQDDMQFFQTKLGGVSGETVARFADVESYSIVRNSVQLKDGMHVPVSKLEEVRS